MSYIKYGVNLSDGQKDKLARALSNKSAITIRLTKSDLTGSDDMIVTPQNVIIAAKCNTDAKCNNNRRKM